MSDDAYFEIVPPRAVTPPAGEAAGAGTPVARGDGWRVERQADGLWLFYISPGHQGDERAILIREGEAQALAGGERTLDDVLIANRAD